LLLKQGLTYMVMADKDFGRRVPFAFIDELAKRSNLSHAK
jgi:hypothetical protein